MSVLSRKTSYVKRYACVPYESKPELFGKLRERLIDLRVGKTIFIGGGSILLRKYIESSNKISACIIIEDIAANEKGYDLLYRADHRK